MPISSEAYLCIAAGLLAGNSYVQSVWNEDRFDSFLLPKIDDC